MPAALAVTGVFAHDRVSAFQAGAHLTDFEPKGQFYRSAVGPHGSAIFTYRQLFLLLVRVFISVREPR
jgi:hypothetical protein